MPDQPKLADIAEAVQRIKNGESELFWHLVSPYQRSLYTTAYSLLENTEDVKEVVQETMLKALKSLDSLKDVQCLRAWLHRIAINEARMRLRGARGEISWDEEEGPEEDFRPRDYADWKDIPSTALERKEIRDAIQHALRSLTPVLREVFTLRDIQEFTVPEVSQMLGIKEAQVSLRLHRARLRMREFLAPIFRSGRSPWMPLQMMPDMPAMLIHRVIRCKSVIREISNFIDNELEAALRAEIEKHLKYCRRCRILLDTTKRVLYLVADEKVYLPPFSLDKNKSGTIDS
jgi:RNA polymerase sigma-70 factor (ECF subfamily)